MKEVSNIFVIEEFLDHMLKKNESINLTAIRERDEAYTLHIEDSLYPIEIIQKYCSGNYGDLGSGCGFPGVAIALALDIHVDLVDSSKKKMNAIKEIINAMGLSDLIDTMPYRVEEMAATHDHHYGLITSRAMTRLDSLLELSSPLLRIGGHLAAYKEDEDKSELEKSLEMQEIVGMSYVEELRYKIQGKKRVVYIFEKTHEPEIKLPRKIGKAQKSPIKPTAKKST